MGKLKQDFSIRKIYTADGGQNETNLFYVDDPFAIVVELDLESPKVGTFYLYDFLLQIVNPRTDPSDIGPWIGKDGKPRATLDFSFTDVLLGSSGNAMVRKKRAKFWASFPTYGDAMSRVAGGNVTGVFAVQATVRQQFASFAFSGPASYAYHYAGKRPPRTPALEDD